MEDQDVHYRVIHIIDEQNLVLNAGKNKGISREDRFLIYGSGEELKDIETGESLGTLEIVRGKGKVVHLQEKMCTVQSDDFFFDPPVTETITRPNLLGSLAYFGNRVHEERKVTKSGSKTRRDFVEPQIGDFARPIKKS